MPAENFPLLVAILGPTASGKSALALHLAQKLNGEILACDSTQLYRGFDIGTGKPTKAERASIPHHLLDVLDPSQEATAGGYRERALHVLADLRARKKLPILTVGTGLYLRALLEGLADLPQRSEEVRARLRVSIEKHGEKHLHKLLARLDPQSAQRIAPADIQKLIRAVEVCLLTQRPLTEVHNQGRTPLEGWQILKIGLEPPRAELYTRIHTRIDAMLAAGWQDEVAHLLNAANDPAKCSAGRSLAGLEEDASPTLSGSTADSKHSVSAITAAKPFDFLGYRELAAVHRHELTFEAARAAIQQSTRHYAKRQQTWFRREKNVLRFANFGDHAETQNQILQAIQKPKSTTGPVGYP